MNPKPYGVNELREMFLSFFESKGKKIVYAKSRRTGAGRTARRL